jgi:tetratricopeptide (TPR) repeat protein
MSAADAAGGGGTAARKAARSGSSGSSGPSRSGRRPGAGAASGSGTATTAGTKGSKGSTATRRQLDPDALVALEEERDFLLRSLDDLEREHDAGDVDDTDYAELKDDYTARAANVLRAIDDRRMLAVSSGSPRSWGRTAGILAIVGVLALGVGWFVFRDAGTRAPGQGLSGDSRQDSANLVLQAQQATAQARVALQDGDSAAALEQFQQAIKAYSRALELSPTNVEAITYRAWVLHNVAGGSTSEQAAQLDQQAMAGLDDAVATDPTYADARVFRAVLLTNLGEFAAAQADLDAIDTAQIPAFMTTTVDGLRAEVKAGLVGSTTTSTIS